MPSKRISLRSGADHNTLLDAGMWEAAPTGNTATASPLRIGKETGNASSIAIEVTFPADGAATLSEVRLALWIWASSLNFKILKSLRDFDIATMTHNEFATGQAWGTAGGLQSGVDFDATPLATFTGNGSLNIVTGNSGSNAALLAYAQACYTAGTPMKLLLQPDHAVNVTDFFSASEVADDAEKPYFDYDYMLSSVPNITNAGDESFYNGETGVVITGSGFGASPGSGSVRICPSNDVNDAGAVTQTVTSWSNTSITITVVKGALGFDGPLYLFVRDNGAGSNSPGYGVQIAARPFIRETLVDLSGAALASQTGLTMVIYHAVPTTASPNPAQVIESVTTNGSGQLNQQINRGALAFNDPVWMGILKDGSPAKGTLRKVSPVYE
jgi:hypothetical protein